MKRWLFELAFLYARYYGLISYWRKKERREEIEDKFRFFLGDRLSPEGLRKVVRHIFELRGTRKVMDYLIPLLDDQIIKRFFTIEGRDHLDRALEKGRGVVLVSGHLGNPHLGFCTLRALGYDLILVKGGSPPRRGPRKFHYAETPEDTIFIYDRELATTYKERIVQTLREGKILQFYADTREGKSKEKVPFLGREMEFPTGVFHLAYQARAAIVPFAHLYHRGKITLRFEEPIDHDWGQGEAEYSRIVAEFAKHLEADMLHSPEQYMGIYGPTVLSDYYHCYGFREPNPRKT